MEAVTDIEQLIEKYEYQKHNLIPILQDIQSMYNYLPKDALITISQKLDLPLSHIFSVANFYTAFSLKPRGKHIIKVCMGTACHVRGAPKILDKLESSLGIISGGTTADGKFSLETVNCLGACALGPLVVIDGEYHGNIKPTEIDKIIKRYASI